jgi:predicted NBD/HSP70 family sugar kinase
VRAAGVSQHAQRRDVPAGSPATLRNLNRTRILRSIRASSSISRVELARETGLSKPTVNKIVAGLLDEGLLRELPIAESRLPGRSGPRPKVVAFRPDFGYVVGVDIGANKLLVHVADLSGRVLASRRAPARGPRRAHAVLAEVRREVEALLASVGIGARDVNVLVIGTPGVVDPVTSRVSLAPQISGWEDTDIVADVRRWLPGRVRVEPEVQLSMLAERWHGAGRDVDDLVYINVGIGIAAGIMIRGERHRGASGAAGEIGYLPIGEAGPIAADGFGSFEWAAGGDAYARLGAEVARTRRGARLRRLAGGDPAAVDAEVVFAAAAQGDAAAVAIVDDLVGRLARGVASVATVVDPSVVVIGGGLSRAGEPLRARLERDVRQLLPRPPRLVLSALGEDGVALGAVTAAIGEWEAMAYAAPIEEA